MLPKLTSPVSILMAPGSLDAEALDHAQAQIQRLVRPPWHGLRVGDSGRA